MKTINQRKTYCYSKQVLNNSLQIVQYNLKAHVHPRDFVLLSFCFGRVHLLNAVFWLGVISQEAIFNYVKFPQCIQGDNGPLKILDH